MTRFLVAYLATAVVFLVVDLLWLAVIARRFYLSQIGDLLLEKPNMAAAVAFYLVYVAGILVFAVAPAFKTGSVSTALFYGAFLGFIAYATYDLTNLATLKNWSAPMVAVDVVWGAVVTCISASAGYLVATALVKG